MSMENPSDTTGSNSMNCATACHRPPLPPAPK